MRKYNVTNSRFLLDLLRKRGRAYSDLRAMCWDNDSQSDHAALELAENLRSELTEFLRGNFDTINRKLREYSRQPPRIAVRLRESPSRRVQPSDFYTTTKTIRLGNRDVLLETTHSNAATPEELVYGVIRRALESGDIKNLALCQQCEKLFYRDSTKGKFCSDDCHNAHFNNLEDRADKAHERYVRKMRKLHGPKVPVARRPRKKLREE